jgi:U3 small nucleolar RNA-associated protein 4
MEPTVPRGAQGSRPADVLVLHRGRFVEWQPAAIVALALTPDGAALALGRGDGSIELYDVANDWHCVLRLPGCERASLTALAWCSPGSGKPPLLLSSSLSGQVVTWDLLALRPLAAVDSNGGPVWHMCSQPPGEHQARPAPRATRAAA